MRQKSLLQLGEFTCLLDAEMQDFMDIQPASNHSMSNASINSTMEFSYWKVTSILIVYVCYPILMVPLTLFLNVSLFIALVATKKQRKPLNVLHMFLLLQNCFFKPLIAIVACIYIPPAVRFCTCSLTSGYIFFFTQFFFTFYQPLNFAALGVFQLLLIKRKNNMVTYKTVIGSIILLCGLSFLSLSICTAFLVRTGDPFYCSLANCPVSDTFFSEARFSGLFLFILLLVSVSAGPSFFVVVVSTTWSCIHFKVEYIRGNDDNYLNRRIVSLPLVLPSLVVLLTFLTLCVYLIVSQYLFRTGITEAPNWAIVTHSITTLSRELLGGVVYPLLLVTLHPPIRQSWKKVMLCKYSKNNAVHATSTS